MPNDKREKYYVECLTCGKVFYRPSSKGESVEVECECGKTVHVPKMHAEVQRLSGQVGTASNVCKRNA